MVHNSSLGLDILRKIKESNYEHNRDEKKFSLIPSSLPTFGQQTDLEPFKKCCSKEQLCTYMNVFDSGHKQCCLEAQIVSCNAISREVHSSPISSAVLQIIGHICYSVV